MACACAGDRKDGESNVIEIALDIKWENVRIVGVEQYQELGEEECDAMYKNKFEVASNLELTKSNLTKFFLDQSRQLFPTYNPLQDNRAINCIALRSPNLTLNAENPTIMVRMVFANQA